MDGGLCDGDDAGGRRRKFVTDHGTDYGREFDGGYGGFGDDDALRHGCREEDTPCVRRPTNSDRDYLGHSFLE